MYIFFYKMFVRVMQMFSFGSSHSIKTTCSGKNCGNKWEGIEIFNCFWMLGIAGWPQPCYCIEMTLLFTHFLFKAVMMNANFWRSITCCQVYHFSNRLFSFFSPSVFGLLVKSLKEHVETYLRTLQIERLSG